MSSAGNSAFVLVLEWRETGNSAFLTIHGGVGYRLPQNRGRLFVSGLHGQLQDTRAAPAPAGAVPEARGALRGARLLPGELRDGCRRAAAVTHRKLRGKLVETR